MPNRLHAFVGTWETEGRQYAGPLGPDAKVKAVETYEWLTGGKFLVHKFEGQIGDEPAASIELIGVEDGTGGGGNAAFPVHVYDGKGISSEWKLQERGSSTWILSGTWPVGGKEARVRCTLIQSADDTLTGRWEYATEGEDWHKSWDVQSVRKGKGS